MGNRKVSPDNSFELFELFWNRVHPRSARHLQIVDCRGSSRRGLDGATSRTGGGARFLGRASRRRHTRRLRAFRGLLAEAGKAKQHVDCDHDYDIPGKLAHDPVLLCSLRAARPAGK